MSDLNDYKCMGRVGNMKMAYLNNGTAVMEMSVAIDQSYKDRDGNKVDRVFWARIKAFGKQAEFIEKWCRKGKRVLVKAEPQERSWEDQQGNKRSVVEFHVGAPGTGVTPIDWPEKDDQGQQPPRQASGGRGRQEYQPDFPSEANGLGDVPF